MTRVAIQLTSTGGFYGAEKTLLELASYLSAQGWESHVIAVEGKGAPELVRRASACGLSAAMYGNGSRLNVVTLLRQLQATLARYPRAVVHSHGYKPDILLAALRIPRRLVCLATCHSWYSDTAKMKLAERLDKRVLRSFAHVVAVSGQIQAELISSGVAAANISRIDNGITVPVRDPEARRRIRNEFGIARDESLIVQVGRLAASKRNDLLLEAVARLPRTISPRVLLVGEGDQRPVLIERARSLGISDRVRFSGYRVDVHQVLVAADVLALTSNKEGLPLVLLEAMALGCPVVATKVGAVPNVIRPNENGLLVPVDDVGSLSRAIEQVLASEALARRLVQRAKQDFLARFSRDVMGKRYLDLYEQQWNARGWT